MHQMPAMDIADISYAYRRLALWSTSIKHSYEGIRTYCPLTCWTTKLSCTVLGCATCLCYETVVASWWYIDSRTLLLAI
eukprot:m.1052885 g.1052885  ORF g.1052885 m.1052885 type:complete len:79 (-) comp24185_c0_seq48:682-918(-)